jgi:hypothetical protein
MRMKANELFLVSKRHEGMPFTTRGKVQLFILMRSIKTGIPK